MGRFFCRIIFLLFLFCIGAFTCQAQYKDDSLAHELVKKHILLNASKQTVPGYRIQLFFGGQREKAYEIRSEYLKEFPQTGAYVMYQQPNFKVRVGDCRTRLEALKLLKEIQPVFNAAFIVKDEVKISW